ncbi:hypothetical protein G6F46_001268 [Rhizopus delemar]|uniref:C2H2-type domain-containing protein n=3 Tax=Rhizopus TaxID=4842 RepID=I1BWU2_RHIO9|nr:hypothetical protein RO3G_05377 [Rhizopus delemar RA 99-880]KAG1056381.1 hypothetical protein G6F43_001722 [Rhizopus delemar]KAG1552885.1 hypothetical protein G6F51_000942 [Rhizopus arrhizus]KAG1466857.1 hypothetical protein G6F55_000218 [Rhizopus delemar]KAG1504701.1 hypothetical protein G6F54_000819 [Rhizopus delemar]|eukprot:EIE80672.1 hypothetical protein RO3G_05377 [Rhizopus delemar RA 99-880]
MYSNTSYQTSFAPTQLTPPEIEIDQCLNNYGSHDSMNYSRRPSYFTGLLSSSESDQEQQQQTPSPFSGYEDYHPLDKRRPSTIVELPQLDSDYSYSTAIHPWLTANMQQTSGNRSPFMYANPAIDMYSPQAYLSNHLCGSLDVDGIFRERASSACSSSSADSSSSVSPPSTRRPSKVTAAKSSVKRSRGRRVSNSPSVAGQKVFTCTHDECGKVFKRSEHLKRHIRSIHTLEKPYECPYQNCSKRFSRSDNLNQHIRIHRHTGKDKISNSTHRNTFNNFMPAY